MSLASFSRAIFTNNNRVEKTGGDSMEGQFTVNGASVSVNGEFLVVGGTSTFKGGFIYLSTSPTSPVFMMVGKQSDNSSTITNSNVSGLLRIMPGKANPQIIMGDATTTGTGFLDASSGRPLALQTLSTGVVQIQNLEMQSNSSMTVISGITISGSGAPVANTAMCRTAAGVWGHCTGIPLLNWSCTCVAP